MATFQPHTITFTADTTLREEGIKDYLLKKMGHGRLRIHAASIATEKQKKPRKNAKRNEAGCQTAKETE